MSLLSCYTVLDPPGYVPGLGAYLEPLVVMVNNETYLEPLVVMVNNETCLEPLVVMVNNETCLEPFVVMVTYPLRVLAREHLHFTPWATRYSSIGQKYFLGLVAKYLAPPLSPLPIGPVCVLPLL